MSNELHKDCKPVSLEGAHAALRSLLSPEQVEQLRSGTLNSLDFHHGLGRHIRNQWLRHGRLARLFTGLGPLSHDAMSGIILDSFVAKLHGREFDLAATAQATSAMERGFYAAQDVRAAATRTQD